MSKNVLWKFFISTHFLNDFSKENITIKIILCELLKNSSAWHFAVTFVAKEYVLNIFFKRYFHIALSRWSVVASRFITTCSQNTLCLYIFDIFLNWFLDGCIPILNLILLKIHFQVCFNSILNLVILSQPLKCTFKVSNI